MTPPSVTVRVTQTRGSAPREAGTAMRIYADHQSGTIGGGALEWEATRIARDMLAQGTAAAHRTMPLGPDLGQCCGGAVTLAFERDAADEVADTTPVWIWGAGHVGRAIAAVVQPLPDWDVTLIDTTAARLPDTPPDGVTPLVAADMVKAARFAPADAHHLIVTYSHDIDLQLCNQLLQQPTGGIGLIGSATKWARFHKRLGEMGHAGDEISTITCPIGNPNLGKHPAAIAIGVAAAMITATTPRG